MPGRPATQQMLVLDFHLVFQTTFKLKLLKYQLKLINYNTNKYANQQTSRQKRKLSLFLSIIILH